MWGYFTEIFIIDILGMNVALKIGMRWIMKKEPARQVGFCCHAHTPTGWGVGDLGLAAQRKHTWYHCSHQTLGCEPLDVTCFPPTERCQLRRACS